MPKEIFPCSYLCDCGRQVNFFENTVWEMERISRRKRTSIGEGGDRHRVIFDKGRAVGMYCPKSDAELLFAPEEPDARPSPSPRAKFTPRLGQVLAFIHLYTVLNRRPPAEMDIAVRLGVTPPSAHGMVITLERKGLIERQPGVARSIRLRIDPQELPPLEL